MTLTTIVAWCSATARSSEARTEAGIVSPGRKRWLRWRVLMLSHTSGSYAHSLTLWEPLRPRTMEMAVPHAPAPMTAISLTGSPQSTLGAGAHALNIRTVSPDDEQRCDYDQRHSEGIAHCGYHPPARNGKSQRPQHAAEGHVTSDGYD